MKRFLGLLLVFLAFLFLSFLIMGSFWKSERREYIPPYQLDQKTPEQVITKFFVNLNFCLSPESKRAMKECFYPNVVLHKDFEEKYKNMLNSLNFPENAPFIFSEVKEVFPDPYYPDVPNQIKIVECELYFLPRIRQDVEFLYHPQIYYFTVVRANDGNWYFVDLTPFSIRFPPSFY